MENSAQTLQNLNSFSSIYNSSPQVEICLSLPSQPLPPMSAHLIHIPSLQETSEKSSYEDEVETMDDNDNEEVSAYYSVSDIIKSLHPSTSTHFPSLLPIPTRRTPKYTLVLDLDETLVHSNLTFDGAADAVIKMSNETSTCKIFCKYRPHMLDFLMSASQMFEVVIFTASHRFYADSVLDAIDPGRKCLKYRFYREHCIERNGFFVKDLRVLGRDLSKTIIVDNSIQAFAYSLDNGIPIASWYGSQNDRELVNLMELLKNIKECDDVRPFLRKKFQLYRYLI
jgi:CTD small phosphatase-like protein 2